MKRCLFFVVFLVMIVTTGSGCAGVSGGEFERRGPTANDAAACDPIFQLYWDEQLRRGPEWGTYLADHRYDDRLSDYSPFARRVAETMDVRMLSMVRSAIPEVADEEQRLNLQLLERILAERVELAAFPGELMPVRQQESPHLTLGMLHTYHPFRTPQDCSNYATRLRAFDRQVGQLIDLMNEGVRRGIVCPRITIEQTLPQIEAMITSDPTSSALYEPAKTLSAEAGGESSRAAIEGGTRDAIKALTRLRDYLKNTYLPACRDSVGICFLPDGKRWYRALARHHTTTDLTPEAIHQLGLDELARTHDQMREIMKEVKFEGSLQDFIRHMRNDPAQHNRSAEEIMRRHRENLAISDANLPKLFGRLPKTPYELKEIEAFRAAGAPAGYYYNAPDDGSRPAYFYVNTFAPETRPIYTMEALAYHEAQPGHHLQLALSQERRDWPAFRRFEYINAFIEGWALYSERLGYELGGYRDPYSRFGQLTYDTWRSARLVVDTGMHYFGWSREKAIDFMKENTGLSEQNIVSEVDRYIAWPGQALAYKIGQLEILRLRAEAEQALGDKFDIRAFHDHLLEEGSLPLSLLATRMRAWIETQK